MHEDYYAKERKMQRNVVKIIDKRYPIRQARFSRFPLKTFVLVKTLRRLNVTKYHLKTKHFGKVFPKKIVFAKNDRNNQSLVQTIPNGQI